MSRVTAFRTAYAQQATSFCFCHAQSEAGTLRQPALIVWPRNMTWEKSAPLQRDQEAPATRAVSVTHSQDLAGRSGNALFLMQYILYHMRNLPAHRHVQRPVDRL